MYRSNPTFTNGKVYQKYDSFDFSFNNSKREEYNHKCLDVVNGRSEELSKQEIYNYYTGIGGLHGLDYKDYKNYHAYSIDKKEFERGQFYTPNNLCEWIMSCIRPTETDRIADITCGKGSFFNYCPVEENIYGCELEENSYKVADYLFEKANIQHGDVRSYKPDILMDIIVGNPPFNIDWIYDGYELTSQTGFFTKASELLYPGGIVAAIVPNSFLSDATSHLEKNLIFEAYNYIIQLPIHINTFKNVGVENFSMKLLILQKKSTSLPERPFTNELSDLTSSSDIYYKHIFPAIQAKKMASPRIHLETKNLPQEKKELEYELKKRLYQIKVHPKTNENYPDCEDCVNHYLTQSCPPEMDYEEWIRNHAISSKQVFDKLKNVFQLQNMVNEDRVSLVKGKHSLYYKGYSPKSKKEAHSQNMRGGELSLHSLITSDSKITLEKCGQYRKLIEKKRRDFRHQTMYYDEMEFDPEIYYWLSHWKLSDRWGEDTIKLNEMQLKDTTHALQKNYSYLQWEQGTGKTVSGVAQGQYRLEHRQVDYVFVISSAISIEMTWAPFLEKYGIPHKVIRNKKDLRNIFPGEFVLITLGRVKNHKRWISQVIRLASKKLMLIYDEAHNSSTMEKNEKAGVLTKAIFACFHRLKYKLLMSGTSISNNVVEVFPQLQLLYNSSHNMLSLSKLIYSYSETHKKYKSKPNKDYGNPYPPYTKGLSLFRKSHLPKKLTVFGVVKTTPDIFNGNALRHISRYTMITRTFKEVSGKNIENISEIPCVMTASEQRVYEVAQKEFYRLEHCYYSSANISARNKAMARAIAQIKTMLRICTCASIFPEYQGVGKTGKMDAIFRKISSLPGERVAIGLRETKAVYEYARQAKKYFPDRKIFTITGGEYTPRQRKKIIDEQFSKYEDFILICTQQSLSESVSIDSIDHCFIAEMHWNETKMSQFYRRFIRFVSTRQKYIYYVNYTESIETNLIYLLVSKERMLQFLKGRDTTFVDLFQEMGFDLSKHQQVMLKKETEDGPELEWGKAEIHEDVIVEAEAA